MFAPPIVGLLVAALAVAGTASAAAPTTPEAADALEAAGSLADAAAIWASIFRGGDDPDKRLVAAYRAQKAWRAAARSTGDRALLCEAQALVAEALRLDLDAEDRGDFEVFAEAIRRELADGHATACGRADITPPTATEVTASTTTDVTTLSATDTATEVTPPIRHARIPSAPQRSTLPTSTTAEDLPRHRPARPYLISGSVTLGAGAVLLGAMTVGLVQNYNAGQTIDAHADKNNTVGLSPTEIAEVEAAQRQVDPSKHLALGAGVAGGALLVTGASLLVWGRELRRSARTALLPTLGPSHAGLSLRGRF
ncbi:MAG: hypothetical protein R3B09_13085 [Nannocystaceae bacterium]